MKTNPSIRIISGSNKGFKINFKPSSKLRPTSDRLKKIAFDWVQFNILNSNCLDLFAGTGSLGLECLSSNASKVTFVDHKNDHINNTNDNSHINSNNKSSDKEIILILLIK